MNFDDPRGKLFFDYVRILKETAPKYFLLENVKMKKEYQDVISSYLGVEPILINSSLVSAQNRKRYYWSNIPNITLPEDKNIMLKDIVGEYDGIYVKPRGYNKGGLQHYNGKSPTITISSWEYNFYISKAGNNVKFSLDDVHKLQTLPNNYVYDIPTTKQYKAIGNGWTVDVIAHIFNHMKE